MISFVSMPAGPAGVPMAVPTGVARAIAGGKGSDFLPVDGVPLSTAIESNVVTLQRVGSAAILTISGGEYSKNGAAYSAASTTVKDGDTLRLRVTSSDRNGQATSAVATIGGLPRTFTVKTAENVGTPTPRAYLMIARGQSNTVGRGTIDGTQDTEQSNIRQFCDIPSRASTYRTIRASVMPLYHPENRVSDNNLSPVNYAAKVLASTLPAGDIVLIVPTAWGGTSLLNSDGNSAPNAPQWSVGRSLHENSIAQANAAVAAVAAAGFIPVVHSIIDVQGEADNRDIAPADYANALTAAISDMRARITGGSGARLILGGFLPEKLATLATLQGIEDARKTVAANIGNAAFVRGASGYVLGDGLDVHFNAAGTRINGRNIGAAAAQITLPPAVTFMGDVTKAEGNAGTTSFVFDGRRSTYSGAATIPVTFGAGSTSADDFAGGAFPSNLVLNFADNSDAATVTVNVNGDTVAEPVKAFSLTLAPNSPYVLGTKPTATGNITDDDNGGPTYLDAPFDAVDGTGLGSYTSPSGHGFTGSGSGFVINNSEVYSTSSGNNLFNSTWNAPSGAYVTKGQFNVLSVSGGQAIRWRIQDTSNFYWVAIVSGTSNWGVYKQVGNSPTSLGAVTQPPGGIAAGGKPMIEVVHGADNMLTVKIDGFTILGPIAESTFTTGGVGGRQSGGMTATTGIHLMSLSTAPIS